MAVEAQSSDGSLLARWVPTHDPPHIELLAESGDLLFAVEALPGLVDDVTCIEFDPDQYHLWITTTDAIFTYDLETRQVVSTDVLHQVGVEAQSPDGSLLARWVPTHVPPRIELLAAGCDFLFEIDKQTLPGLVDDVTCIEFDPDQYHLWITTTKATYTYDLEIKELVSIEALDQVRVEAFSPDGSLLARWVPPCIELLAAGCDILFEIDKQTLPGLADDVTCIEFDQDQYHLRITTTKATYTYDLEIKGIVSTEMLQES